jgi:hypothetical protein
MIQVVASIIFNSSRILIASIGPQNTSRVIVNPLDYLRDILERMLATKTSELRSLVPDQWKPRVVN